MTNPLLQPQEAWSACCTKPSNKYFQIIEYTICLESLSVKQTKFELIYAGFFISRCFQNKSWKFSNKRLWKTNGGFLLFKEDLAIFLIKLNDFKKNDFMEKCLHDLWKWLHVEYLSIFLFYLQRSIVMFEIVSCRITRSHHQTSSTRIKPRAECNGETIT